MEKDVSLRWYRARRGRPGGPLTTFQLNYRANCSSFKWQPWRKNWTLECILALLHFSRSKFRKTARLSRPLHGQRYPTLLVIRHSAFPARKNRSYDRGAVWYRWAARSESRTLGRPPSFHHVFETVFSARRLIILKQSSSEPITSNV